MTDFFDALLLAEHTDLVVQFLFYTILTVVALFVWLKLVKVVSHRIAASRSLWDDAVLNAAKKPVPILIVLLGAQSLVEIVLAELNLPAFTAMMETVHSVILFGVVFWLVFRLTAYIETAFKHFSQQNNTGRQIDKSTVKSIFYTIRAVILLVAVITLLDLAGVSISGLLAAGGLGGILLGFAAKDTLSNFFAGTLIYWERPFVEGDWIRQPDENIEGVVEVIGWRSTQIRTFDYRPIYVPNSKFFNSVIENPQRMSNRRIYEYMGLRYQDIEKMPAVLNDIRQYLANNDNLDHDKIQMVSFDKYGASSLDFFVYTMTKTTEWKKFHDVKEEVLFSIATIVKKHGCDFAFPTKTVYYKMDANGDNPAPLSPASLSES